LNKLYHDLLSSNIRCILNNSQSIQNIDHNGIKGGLREIFLQNLIRPYLNPSLDICSGKIIDSYNKQSKQIDCIIYDPTIIPPAFLNQLVGIIPYESVLATIEVKTTINNTEIVKCIKNAISVKKLTANWSSEINGPSGKRLTPYCTVFGYHSDLSSKDEYIRYIDTFEKMKSNGENNNVFLPISLFCVANRCSFRCTDAKDIHNLPFEIIQNNNDYEEIKYFIAWITSVCNYFRTQRGEQFIGNYIF